MNMALTSAPLALLMSSSSACIGISSSCSSCTTTPHRRLAHNLFSMLPSPQLPFSLLSRESAILNPRRPSLSCTKCTAWKLYCRPVEVEDVIDEEACELVNGVELSIGEGIDSIRAYLFKAVKNNNGTGILLLSDIFGFEDSSTRDFAYRVACNGYNVLVPDLFRGNPWAKDRPKALFEEWLAKQTMERISDNIKRCTKWMMDEFVAAGISKKLGIIGFCFGGGRVIDVLAQDQGVCFGIGVSFYGTKIDPSSIAAGSVKVPVLFIAGDNDPLCPIIVLKDAEKRISSARVLVFAGRGHGFAHQPQSPEEDGDAEKAFKVMRNWLYDGLVLGT